MLNAYSVDSFVLIRSGGVDSRGEPLATTEETVKGYMEWKTKLVRNMEGEEVVSRGYVFIIYDGTINHEDRIKISGVEYPIIALEPAKDFSNIGLRVYIA